MEINEDGFMEEYIALCIKFGLYFSSCEEIGILRLTEDPEKQEDQIRGAM